MISAPSRRASAMPTQVLPTAVAPVRNQQFVTAGLDVGLDDVGLDDIGSSSRWKFAALLGVPNCFAARCCLHYRIGLNL